MELLSGRSAEQEPQVQAQLTEIRKQYAALKPEDILVIDPCAGQRPHSRRALFDVLVQIYEDYGYTAPRSRCAASCRTTCWGLDIDDRAAQLAVFCRDDEGPPVRPPLLHHRQVQPHVYAIQESNDIKPQPPELSGAWSERL